jgi:tetratricopeptide (TPR) repeat protein
VNYVVEGSGQKIGGQILLNIQMIEALNDTHVWSEQYHREAKDIFNLQTEVAKKIADEIEVIITPEEIEMIEKIPTENLEAYDNFLKGLDLFYTGNRESLFEAITYFNLAIEQDGEFARAYADVAISYYFLDIFQYEKEYSEQINNYADKALLLDPKLPQSLISKALFYMNNAEYDMALPYLEKALEYNPNSALVINILSDFYTNYIPDPG